MVIISIDMEYLAINWIMILTCLVQHISCVLRVDTGVMTKAPVESRNVTEQVDSLQVNIDKQVWTDGDAINKDKNEAITSSGFYSESNFVDGDITTFSNGNKHRNLKNNRKIRRRLERPHDKTSVTHHNVHHLIVNTDTMDKVTKSFTDKNHFPKGDEVTQTIGNGAHEIVPSTDGMTISTSLEELDGLIIGSIIGGFVAIWAIVVVTIVCCSFCNYHPLHRQRLAEVYREHGIEDNWYTMSDYSDYKRDYHRI